MEYLSQRVAVVSCVDPDAYTTGTTNDDVIDMMDFKRVMYIVMAGVLGSGATLNFYVFGDTASGGSYTTLITGKSITQLSEGGTDADKQAIVEVSAAEVLAQGLRYIRGTLVILGATSDAGAVAIGEPAHYLPPTADDLASVDEIVA